MEKIVKELNAAGIIKGSLWTKKGNRIYIKDARKACIYNTKKMSQSVYIDLDTMQVKCFTECYNQPSEWCISQSNRVIADLQSTLRLVRMMVGKMNRQPVAAQPVAAQPVTIAATIKAAAPVAAAVCIQLSLF